MQVKERVTWMSRQAKRFIGDKILGDASLDYESDVSGLVIAHPNWVCDENDLTEEGKAVRKYLLDNPHLINE